VYANGDEKIAEFFWAACADIRAEDNLKMNHLIFSGNLFHIKQ